MCFRHTKKAVDRYIEKNIKNVFVVCDSHHKIDEYVVGKVDCIVYNLGYLPGRDKKVATNAKTTIESIKKGLSLLKPGGIMCIAMYTRYPKRVSEKDELFEFGKTIPKIECSVMVHSFHNRSSSSLILMVVEKN